MGTLSPLMRKDLFSGLLIKESFAEHVQGRRVARHYGTPKKVTAFACVGCSSLHQGEDDAATCCSPSEELAFECARCFRLSRSQDRAAACCASRPPPPPTMESIHVDRLRPVYCPVCGDSYGKEGSEDGDTGWPYAARCCLGADLSPAQTWEIARLVKYGRMEWPDAIERVAGGSHA